MKNTEFLAEFLQLVLPSQAIEGTKRIKCAMEMLLISYVLSFHMIAFYFTVYIRGHIY